MKAEQNKSHPRPGIFAILHSDPYLNGIPSWAATKGHLVVLGWLMQFGFAWGFLGGSRF